ncbi:MAG TPA: GNAT family N-acetyltransferase [Methanospirillum sp.]|nr:GNAT family N-acetyltransferase [Methanospirillum sp.]
MPDSAVLQIQFLPLTEADLPRMNELANNPEIAEHFETIPPVSMESTQEFWSYIQSGIISFWAIHADGTIIGGAGYYAMPAGTRLSHIVTFFLYIEPAYWGRGIGRRVIAFLEEVVKKNGYIRMECMVANTNPRAIRLYQQSGYEKEGTKKQAYWIDGRYEDLIIMAKVFPHP